MPPNYKETFIYRVVKVSTVMFMIGGVIIFVILGYFNIPESYSYYSYGRKYEGVTGKWSDALGLWIIGIGFVYFIGHVIRETLLYIIFGKPYSWNWVQKLQI